MVFAIYLVVASMSGLAAVGFVLAGMSESLGLLAFGLGLAGLAVIIRWLIAPHDSQNPEHQAERENLIGEKQ